jgi:hypothetical protein
MLNWRKLRITTGNPDELDMSLLDAVNGGLPDWIAGHFWTARLSEEDGSIAEMDQLYVCTPDEMTDIRAGVDEDILRLYDCPKNPVDWSNFPQSFADRLDYRGDDEGES